MFIKKYFVNKIVLQKDKYLWHKCFFFASLRLFLRLSPILNYVCNVHQHQSKTVSAVKLGIGIAIFDGLLLKMQCSTDQELCSLIILL